MGSRRLRPVPVAATVVVVVGLLAGILVLVGGRHTGSAPTPAASAPRARWVGSWAAAPIRDASLGCADCTLRSVVHVSLGGTAVRVRLANTFGRTALPVAHTTVALPAAAGSSAVRPGTLCQVTFHGRRQVRVPAGATVWSDPVRLDLPAETDLLVSLYFPGRARRLTAHPAAHQTSFVARHGDRSAQTGPMGFDPGVSGWFVLDGVDVRSTTAAGAVVTLGDSITAGSHSTLDADRRWPDFLARAVLDDPHGAPWGVLNAGISGNRLLSSAGNGPAGLRRLDADVLAQTGVRTVVVLEGINDIDYTPHLTAARLIDGYRAVLARLHAHGLRVLGGTLTPFGGSAHATARKERVRETVNAWIRQSGAFDGVIDFAAAVRDPAAPRRLAPRYDSGDHLHPSDAGYRAMAAAVAPGQLGGRSGPVDKAAHGTTA